MVGSLSDDECIHLMFNAIIEWHTLFKSDRKRKPYWMDQLASYLSYLAMGILRFSFQSAVAFGYCVGSRILFIATPERPAKSSQALRSKPVNI